MDNKSSIDVFENTAQRVVSTYRRMLREFCPDPSSGVSHEAQNDLHVFFQALYTALYSTPQAFGLPAAEDIFLLEVHSKEGPNKTDVKKALDRQRKPVEEGLIFLSTAARDGQLAGDRLVFGLESAAVSFLKKKAGKAWASGLESVGLTIALIEEGWSMTSSHFPRMMPALKALAEACARCQPEGLGRVFFARCDFRALAGDYQITAPELFTIFGPTEAAWAAEMHAYFTGRAYQAQVEIANMFQWIVKYQGKRSIKATPLFEISFDERFQQQMRSGIKCASVQRIAPLLVQQSQALQDDFVRRANRCGNCNWCDTRPHLGPTDYVYQGESLKVCWYVNPDITEFSPRTAGLVKEYALVHEGLG